MLLMLVVLPLSVGMACNILGDSSTSAPPTPATTLSPMALPPATATPTLPFVTSTPTTTPTPCNCTPTPMPSLNRDELKRPGAPNADKAYDLYLAMYKADKTESKNWWWKGESDFTVWKFMAIMWGYDAVLDLPLVRDAMHNRAKAFCPGDPPCDPQTPEGSLRYLTVFAQSGRDRIKAWQPGTDPLTVLDYEPNIQAGTHIVDAIKTSDVDNVNNLDAMAPFDYGNISLNPLYSKMVSEGWVLLSIPATSGNTFFVLSKCQYYFAQAGINPREGNKPLEPTQANYNLYCK